MGFKLIVAGGRNFNDYALLSAELFALAEGELNAESVEIVSGMARGADALGFHFAQTEGVLCHQFPADWDKYGKGAGYKRNQQMADFSDGLLAFWDGKSRGTAHMIQTMERMGKKVRVVRYGLTEQVKPSQPIKWSRRGGYECSSKGDKRFSALFAVMPDGRTIEQHYQCDVKGYDVGGRNWRLGKGKPPLDNSKDMWVEYLELWKQWAKYNPSLIKELIGHAEAHNNTLTDMFATTPVNQARALAEILNSL